MSTNLAGREEFISGVRSRFPDSLHEMVDLEDELLQVDMGNFARTTERAILENNMETAVAHFNFISDLFAKAGPELENAIFVSYLENVFLFQNEQKYLEARKLLPKNLVKALTELEQHFEKLHNAGKDT